VIGQADVIAFVATVDQARSRAFYEGVRGLTVTEDSGYATAYDANGTMLRVTIVEEVRPAPYTVLGWAVADVEAALARSPSSRSATRGSTRTGTAFGQRRAGPGSPGSATRTATSCR
jgi:hypothetical protein